jgi:hypothetical protein
MNNFDRLKRACSCSDPALWARYWTPPGICSSTWVTRKSQCGNWQRRSSTLLPRSTPTSPTRETSSTEVAVDIIGEDYQRVGDIKTAVEIFKLNFLAYPNSADANDNLGGAYLADEQRTSTGNMLKKHCSCWTPTRRQHRGPIRSRSATGFIEQ